ncbi:MAG: THUMP-like domain-containing protein [Sporichthyaceae bacterium]
MDLAAFAWLRSPAGAAALDTLANAGPLDDGAALALGQGLRRTCEPHLAAAAMTQARLRQRAQAKFGAAAAGMWFTSDGLEQATHPLVAAHRAARVTESVGPGTAVLDLCCGIGSDLLAFAAAGAHRPRGVDADPLTAALAGANLDGRAQVSVADATGVDLHADLHSAGVVFVDPARRTTRGRVFDPDAYRPPFSFVRSLLDGSAGVSAAAAKLAPGIPHELAPAGCELEWVSLRGELKEAALYSPALASNSAAGAVRRRATLLPGGASLTSAITDAQEAPPPVAAPGRWLYEPDAAVIRAHLVADLAAQLDAHLLDPTIAYLSAHELRPTPFATAYEITDVLAFSVKALRALLRERGVGTLTVKKRGSAIEPEQLRRQLLQGRQGPVATTLFVTRRAGEAVALLAQPVTRSA